MKLLFSLFAFLIFITLSSCDVNEPKKDKPKPEGYQEDIPWPSLADSPWPMYHHDAQNTGRSQYEGPSMGIIHKIISASDIQSGTTIGYKKTFFYTYSGKLASSDYEGNRNWEIKLGNELHNSPLISNDSTIYISDNIRSIFAFDFKGRAKWEYKLNSSKKIWNATLGMDKAGNIYFTSNKELFVLSKSGELLWSLYDERFLSSSDVTFSFSPDGNTVYLQGSSVSLLAVDLTTHTVKWTFGDRTQNSGAVVDSKGNIYLFPKSDFSTVENYFYCLNPDGEIKWKFRHDEQYFDFDNVEPAIDKYGNIYFGFHNLYSLDYTGKLRWKINFGERTGIVSSILVDKSGNIFIAINDESVKIKAVSFDSNGNKRWEIPLDAWAISSSMAISDNGLLLVPTFKDYNFFIIK